MQYDHPNHTVTVTTISDLDLSRAHLLGSAENQVNAEVCLKQSAKEMFMIKVMTLTQNISDFKAEGDNDEENKGGEEKTHTMPKKAGNPIVNKK